MSPRRSKRSGSSQAGPAPYVPVRVDTANCSSILSEPQPEAMPPNANASTTRLLLVFRLGSAVSILPTTVAPYFADGAYVPTVFVGMYATLGMSMPSEHSVDAQDRTVIPKIEPPTRPPPVARVLDQASFHGIVVHVMQMIEAVIVL